MANGARTAKTSADAVVTMATDGKAPKAFYASACKSKDSLPEDFVQAVQSIEKALKRRVVLYMQSDSDGSDMGWVSDAPFEALRKVDLPHNPIVIIHSAGGLGDGAFKTVRLLQDRCGRYTALVPECAKSAATLIAIGATAIWTGEFGELGPIDAQIMDYDIGEHKSALEVVQAVERLRSEALETLAQTCRTIYTGTHLPFSAHLPIAADFTNGLLRPLMEKVDVVTYMRMSRTLKIGEEYAIRIMEPVYGDRAPAIANRLARNYPDHGFVIYADEAAAIGLRAAVANDKILPYVELIRAHAGRITAYGTLEELIEEKQDSNE